MSSNKPFPSSDLDVFKENSLILDNFVNSQENEYPDRFNRKRPTITGIIKEAFNVRTDISNMNETLIGQSRWDAVPKNTSLSLGGDNGALNKQAQALFNRTEMLKVHAREALRRSYLESGLNLVEGSFEQGAVITSTTDVVLHEKTGKVYSWANNFPKVVNKGTLPTSEVEFVDKTNVVDLTDPMSFGALGDGETNDTQALLLTIAHNEVVNIKAGKTFLIDPITVVKNNLVINLEVGGKLIFNNNTTRNGMLITGSFVTISGYGEITALEGKIFPGFLVFSEGYRTIINGVKIFYPSKQTYVGDGVNIPYNTGVVGMNAPFSKVTDCTIYNGRGAGIYNTREKTLIKGNRIFNNILGVALAYGGSQGFGSNCKVINNFIYDNDVTPSYSGASGILTWKETFGHEISGNDISGSGEHGTYIQSYRNVVTDNVVYSNHSSGIKLGGGFGSIISCNNSYDNNTGELQDAAEIYMQSPMGSSVISGNNVKSIDSRNTLGIRVVRLENKHLDGEENKINVSNNIITSKKSIWVYGDSSINVSDNICSGRIQIGAALTNALTLKNPLVKGNVSESIVITKTDGCYVMNNKADDLTIEDNAKGTTIDTNDFIAQKTNISLNGLSIFNNNKLTFIGSGHIFVQASSKLANCNKTIIGNTFIGNDTNNDVINFTSEAVSGDELIITDNKVSNIRRLFDGYGLRHVINNNIQIGGIIGINHRAGSSSGKSFICNNVMSVTSTPSDNVASNNFNNRL